VTIAESAPSKFNWLVLQVSASLLIMTGVAMPQSQPPVHQLISELPPCSVLRAELEGGTYGRGIDQPYMGRMRQQGVKRAFLGLRATVHGNRAANVRVVRRLYFREADSPGSLISDGATLKAIEASGLARDLDALARNRALAAPFVRGHPIPFADNQVSSFVEFFANAWLPEQKVLLLLSGHPNPLTEAVVNGDTEGTRVLLTSHRFVKKDINRALFDAALSRYDNGDVIKLLSDAGADINARTPDGATPLMNAVAHPCNLRPLLDRGADLNARDKWGRNALQLARDANETSAIRLLEEAGAKKHG
jgi:hypothetical protein